MTVIEDKAQQNKKHESKHNYWIAHDVDFIQLPLPVGDYVLMNDKIRDVIDRKGKRGIDVKKMDLLGTYDIVVDTKKDMQEIVGDICGKQHERFRDECILAQNNGVRLIVLIENKGEYLDKRETIYQKPVKSVQDVFSWKNKRAFIFKGGRQLYPHATKGAALAKSMISMNLKYGVEFRFCEPKDAGRVVLEILNEGI